MVALAEKNAESALLSDFDRELWRNLQKKGAQLSEFEKLVAEKYAQIAGCREALPVPKKAPRARPPQ